MIGGGRSSADWAAFANGVHIRYLGLQRHVPLAGAGPSQRQLGGRPEPSGEQVGATRPRPGSPRRRWPTRSSAASATPPASAPGGGTTSPTDASPSALAAAKLLKIGPRRRRSTPWASPGTTGTALRLTRAGELSMWKGCAFAHCGAQRRVRRPARRRRHDRTGPPVRGRHGLLPAGLRPVRPSPHLGGPRASDWMLPKTSIKFVPAEYHSQSAIAAAFAMRAPEDRRPRRASARSRSPPSARPSRSSARTPRNGGPGPARPPTTASPTARPSLWSTARFRRLNSLTNA